MKCKGIIFFVVLILILSPVLSGANPSNSSGNNNDTEELINCLNIEQPPLPVELQEYYKSFRREYYADFLNLYGFGLHTVENHYKLKNLMNYMIVHDSGGLNTKTSKLAKEYLETVALNPVLENKSVLLQTGEVINFNNSKKLNRLQEAQLIYYYCRDHIYFPHPFEKDVPLLTCANIPYIIRFPCEIVESQHGVCCDQALLLACLYNIRNYTVTISSAPEQLPNDYNPQIRGVPSDETMWMIYHSFNFLKIEETNDMWFGLYSIEMANFGPLLSYNPLPLSRMTAGEGVNLQEDVYGNRMDGLWIFLDPIYSPRHFKENSLRFGELSFWFMPMLLTQTNWVPLNPLLLSSLIVDDARAEKCEYALPLHSE